MVDWLHSASSALGFTNIGDFAWILFGTVLAGLVKGFAGFGTAMVFLPFAGAVLSPIGAITVLIIMELIAPIPLIPRTAKDCDAADLARLGTGVLAGLPVGVYVLTHLPAEVFRYAVTLLTLLMLVVIVLGVRFRGELTRSLVYGSGGIGGFMAGAVGLPGPPVILVYLASPLPAVTIRANLFLYLLIADVLLLLIFAIQDILRLQPVLIGVAVTAVYFAGIAAGAKAFRPEKEKEYRIVAYLVIAGSAIGGLPLFG